jgi:hypothetical protein
MNFFIKKLLYLNNISDMSDLAYIFSFILFTQFHMCCYFYYILLILINKFGWHKQINILFCDIKYLDVHLSSLFPVSLLVVVNKFFWFIYIDDDQFISCLDKLFYLHSKMYKHISKQLI